MSRDSLECKINFVNHTWDETSMWVVSAYCKRMRAALRRIGSQDIFFKIAGSVLTIVVFIYADDITASD